MLPLTEAQKQRVEENIGLVYQVIKDCVHGLAPGSLYSYDDLFQIGCLGLCKAAHTDRPGRGAFSTYAYILIRNEIYTALEQSTRHCLEVAMDPQEIPCVELRDESEQIIACSELLTQLDQAEENASGVTARGIKAIRLLMEGYTSRDIGDMFGTTANNVTAWVSRARKYMKGMCAV